MVNPFMRLEALDFGHPAAVALHNLADWIAGEEEQPEVDAFEVQDRYNQQRDGVRSRAADAGFHGEFRPREVLDADEFERHDVATLRQKVDQIDLQAVGDLVTAWNTIADRHQASLETFTAAMARATDDSVWRGEARNAAASAVSDYAIQGAQVSNAARLTGNKLDELRTGLEPTKQLVPHAPQHRSGLDNVAAVIVGRDWRNDDVAEYNAKAEALRVLRTVYAPVVMESDTNVPVIPRPASVANPGATGDGSGPRSTNDGSGNPSGTSSPSSDPSSAKPTEDSTTRSSDQPSGNASETSQSPGTDPASTAQDSTTPASTTPASAMPGSATPASATPTPSTSPHSPGGPHPDRPGSPGSPTGPGAPGVSAPPKGTGNPTAAVPVATTRTGAVPGRAGTNGMGGMAPGAGRGGKSDEESTKGIPDYLITQEHGYELTGLDELPRTVPPVIGDNPR